MALTAANFTEIDRGVIGDLRYYIGTMTGDASYTTGGSTVTPAMVGMNLGILFCAVIGPSAGNRVISPLKQADGSYKVKLFTALTTEVANAATDAANSYVVFCMGR